MTSHRVELLAPAGNYESFVGAINAGADAIYVGGEKFSARAYADNFDTQTLCDSIKYAHLFGRRVYLTLNTLIKEAEFSEIYDYVKPFYLAGLDGVIIQDFGVLRFLKRHFPHMELHASTQMAVTGPEFVSMCRELGISRVVPARELSLAELKSIRDAGIEVECFIHGAMCYCYSGMCLMSSILGGRSGNRGKCAQPCRLPYQVSLEEKFSKDTHTLSLKDMCTIEHVPALIEAGMDSFKIEGRMKRSEYAAGVTALYRKYIDRYYKHPDKPFRISKEDKDILEHLYMRSELHDGYLFKHNGKEMVTKDAPSYNGLDDSILADIRTKYIGYTQKLPISMYGYFEVGQESSLTVYTDSGVSVTVNGPTVDAAQKVAASVESVTKQLGKLGNTHFELNNVDICLQGDVFLPNGMLNTLRREALEKLQEAIILANFPDLAKRYDESAVIYTSEECTVIEKLAEERPQEGLTLLIKTPQQLEVLSRHTILSQVKVLYLEEKAMESYLISESGKKIRQTFHCSGADQNKVVFVMPYVLRKKDYSAAKNTLQELYQNGIRQVLVRNVESLSLVRNLQEEFPFEIITDASLYCWNREAKNALLTYAKRVTLPFELNSKELRELRSKETEQIIYGYIPLMITANCVFKTNDACKSGSETGTHKATLKDRYGKVFTVLTNCKHCYNTIYNSVPLSLHKKYNKALPGSYRIQFSIEDEQDMQEILCYYEKWLQGMKAEFPVKEYTTAHENRQVE